MNDQTDERATSVTDPIERLIWLGAPSEAIDLLRRYATALDTIASGSVDHATMRVVARDARGG